MLELTHLPAKAGLTAFTRLVRWVRRAVAARIGRGAAPAASAPSSPALLASFSARVTIAFLLVWLTGLALIGTISRAIREAPGFDEVAAATVS